MPSSLRLPRRIPNLLRWLIPPSLVGVLLTCLALVLAAAVYYARANVDEFIMDAGLGLFFSLPLILLVLFAFFTVSVALLISSIHYAVHTRGNILPILMLCVSFALAMITSLPAPAVAQEFMTYRSQYEAVVSFAKEGKLAQDSECLDGFALPDEYKHLTRSCLKGVDKPALALVFSPPSTHRLIIYLEKPEVLSAVVACCLPDGSFYQEIDGHWYFFTPAQD